MRVSSQTLAITKMSEPFIPRDKPRSWVIAICSGLICLLGFGPLLFISAYFDVSWLFQVSSLGATLCVVTFFVMWAIFVPRLLLGHYKQLEPQDWSSQLW